MQPKRRLLLSLLIVTASALGPAVLHAGDRYYNADHGFSLEFPVDWVRQEYFMGTEVAAYSQDPSVRLTANVIVEELPREITLDEYFEVSVDMMSMFQNFTEHELGRTVLNGTPARWLVYSYGSDQVAFKALAYLMVSGKTGYVLTCGSTPETFEQARPLLEQIAGTFRLEAGGQAGAQSTPRNALPEIAVKMQPEPGPSEEPPPRTSLAPAPAGNPFALTIEQDGQTVQVIDHTARLKRKTFALVFTFRAPDSVLVNMSGNPQSYEAARAGLPLAKITGFGSAGLIEGVGNAEQEAILSDTAYQYWFYGTPSMNRFDKTREESGLIICRRTVARLFFADNGKSLPLERFTGKALYLVVIKGDQPNRFAEAREYQREYLQIILSD